MLDEMANKKLTYSQMHMELLTLKQKSHACFYTLEYEYLEKYRRKIRKKKHSFQIKPMYCIHPKAFTGLVKGINVLPSSLRSAATGLGKVSIDVRGGLRS